MQIAISKVHSDNLTLPELYGAMSQVVKASTGVLLHSKHKQDSSKRCLCPKVNLNRVISG